MRLLAHNVMASHVKGVKNGYPFKLAASEVNILEADFDEDFVRAMLPRLRYDVLRNAAIQVGHGDGLPEQLPEDAATNTEFLQRVHHVLLCVDIVEGSLTCPESGKEFPIRGSCANMLLKEDEV